MRSVQRRGGAILLIVQGEAVDHVGACLVDADHLDPPAGLAKFQHHLVQSADRGNVPQMRLRDIDCHRLNLFGEIESGNEAFRRGEENLTIDAIDPLPAIGRKLRPDMEEFRHLAREKHAGEKDAGQHALCEIVGRKHRADRDQHDDAGGWRVAAQIEDGAPRECADGDHDHHRHQRGHGNDTHEIIQHQYEEQQERARDEGRQAATTARTDIDDGLADHGAAAHAADEGGGDIARSLPDAFPALVAARIRHVVDDLRRQQRFQQTDGGERHGIGKDDLQRLEGQWYLWQGEYRQRGGQFTEIADRADIHAGEDGDTGENDDGDQRRRHDFGDQREEIDDRKTGSDHDIGFDRDADQFRQLRHEDQDRQRIDEAGHDRTRDEAHHPAEFYKARQNLQHAHEDGGGEEILQPVFLDERNHQDGRGGGCRRDHARSAAGEGGNAGDRKGGEQPHLRIDPGDDGKADGFGNEGECHDDAGKEIAANIGKPLTSVSLKSVHLIFSQIMTHRPEPCPVD
ncbi:hypothetical protein AT6N2_C1179 [Agrobacterium tumefaciens]|nr:hypothetical protein AT6N2_C1179 [Agrobacterium tumefaciens]